MRLQPNDFIEIRFAGMLQQGLITEYDIIRMRDELGLNNSIFVGYFMWLGQVLQGNLGMSFVFEQPISTVMGSRMGVSFTIALISMVLSMAIAIPLGTLAATKQYSKFDYSSTAVVMAGISFPSFFFAGLVIWLFAVQLGWLPSGGQISATLPPDASNAQIFFSRAHHLVLPILVMTVLGVGGLMRHTRTNTLEVLRADYIRTARAKGVSEIGVISRHAFKNTAIPLATMVGGLLPGLFGGAIVIEQIFAIDGVGFAALRALQQGDIPFAMAFNMFMAILTVGGILISDIMYAIVDPRVKLN